MSFCHRLALVGCGGMGRRHLRGYRVLLDFEPDRLEVSAVVDPELERAEFLAGEAEELFGTRPSVYRSLEDAISGTPDLSVVDIVTAVAAPITLLRCRRLPRVYMRYVKNRWRPQLPPAV